MHYFGFDIGGSSVKAVLAEDKKIIQSAIKDLPDNFSGLLDLILRVKNDLQKDAGLTRGIQGIGFGLAGALDAERQTMLYSPNIEYLNSLPVKKLLEEKLAPCPVKIENDVRCFLMAEKEMGAAQIFENIFFLAFGSGVGGAWMMNGKIQIGEHGCAGEAGHMILEVGEGTDFEELASNKFVVKKLGVGSAEALEKAKEGDRKAREVFAELGRNIGFGVANIINVFDPEAVILGGGIVEAKDFISAEIKKMVGEFVVSPAAKETQVLFSGLGRLGGALGASLLFNHIL